MTPAERDRWEARIAIAERRCNRYADLLMAVAIVALCIGVGLGYLICKIAG